MTNIEKQVGVVKDLILPVDSATRYDVYFTDKRIAIAYMGRADRSHGNDTYSLVPFAPAPITSTSMEQRKKDRQMMEEQISHLPLDQLLSLSKKSCEYSYDEVEEVKLVAGKRLKFVILSKEYESKFAPNNEQFGQLSELLPKIEMLKDKLTLYGSWKPSDEEQGVSCKHCGGKNDFDAVFCDSCGKRIREETLADSGPDLTCKSCGAKNRVQAIFCKRCGNPLH